MAESFDATRDRMLKDARMAKEDLLGFECDLDHGLRESGIVDSWKITRTCDPRCMLVARCLAGTDDTAMLERRLAAAYEEHVRYLAESTAVVEHGDGLLTFRFATRSESWLVATGEIRVSFRGT